MERRWTYPLQLIVILAFLAGASILISSFLSGCSKEKEPIKIGIATTLTGPASTSGIHSRNAVTLAVEQLNNAGGIHGRLVELVIRDDKGQADEALRVDRALVDQGVVAIIGHYLSTLSVKAVPFLNERQVVMISSGTTTPELTGIDDYLIRLMVSDDRRAQLMADMTLDRLQIKKMAVVYDLSNPQYTVPLTEHFQKNFTEKGGEIAASVAFNSLEKYSAVAVADKVIKSEAEGVLLITNAINGALLCQHLKKEKPSIKIHASPWTLPEVDFVKNGGRSVEGATCLVELDLESSSRNFQTFKGQYKRRYDEELSLNGYMAYEAVQVLFQALMKTTEPGELKEVILEQGGYQGLIDTIRIDAFGDATRPLYILEIKDAVVRTVGKMEL